MQTATLLSTLLLVVSAASPLHAQDAQVSIWWAAVQTHKSGVVDDAARTVSTLSRDKAIGILRRAIFSRPFPPTANVVKALALHTDAAIGEHVTGERARAKARAGPAPSSSVSATLFDGESLGDSPRSLQWELARLIAGNLATRAAFNLPDGTPDPDRPAGADPARAWYRASSALLQLWADCGNLRVILEEGLRLFPTDATLLLYRGTLHQTFADGRVQVWIKDGSAAPRGERLPTIPRRVRNNDDELPAPDENGTAIGLNRGSDTGAGPANRAALMRIGAPSLELSLAEGDLRRALAIEPALVEARIRLAHVLILKGEAPEAATLARTAAGQALPPFLDYYGAMVLGRAEQAAGRRGEARAAFMRAAAKVPAAQSPRIALSLLAMADGRSGDGIAELVAGNGPTAQRDADDPWWWYFRRHEPDATAQLTAFRERVR